MIIPKIGESLNEEQVNFLKVLSKSCRNSIVAMVTNAQSGHPGGACSSIDYLAILYAFIISQSGEDLVVSNGHISAGVYSILAEMGYIPREEVIQDFRKIGKIYEGHITRHVKGINYGTGPLGVGTSVACGFAIKEKLEKTNNRVFAIAGDGECDEGQIYEMMNFANKYKLSNLTLFIDYNDVQLTDKLEITMPINLKGTFESANWNVLECNGHDYQSIWNAISESYNSDKPTVIIGKTIMGKGVTFMEPDGAEYKSTWHGIPPKPEQAEIELNGPLKISDEERSILDNFIKNSVKWQPAVPQITKQLSIMPNVDSGKPNILEAGTKSDCRGAYGKALLDLAKLNPNIVAMTADLGGSVKTAVMEKEFPERVFEVGIAEQHMVSFAGGLSIKNYIPFASTFGVFMTSRAKDQARLNDINATNVKMVSTHCGLSVGEDGPTHQTVDDMGSFLGFFNTYILEPADANQTDHIIRYIASHYGNFYVRMGRHKFEVILKEDGTPFYDENYKFEYGKADKLRTGDKITVIAGGSTVNIAVNIADKMKNELSVEVIAVSSLKNIDMSIIKPSLEKTGKLITIEDHNPHSGLASQINNAIAKEGLSVKIENLAVREYQLSGKPLELYASAGIGSENLEEAIKKII
ncbi:transketolase [Candidatus Peregrinibacteria bacterium]|nr:transketolase [Candidatus Peregrinibacteria bacterium]